VGDSANYATVSVMAATLASAPGTPTRKFSSETSIGIEWTAPADNGGTPITDYQVFWDSGEGGAYTLLGNSLNTLEYTPSYTLNTGYTYRFKVKAVNYIGVGPESASLSVIAASYPDEPAAPYLFQASQNQLTIQWDSVYDGGTTILTYRVFLAVVGSSATGSRLLADPSFTDVTNSGTLDLSSR